MPRSFLPELNIVEAMLVFREGKLLLTSLDYFVKTADKTIVMMDNQDAETEEIVKAYQGEYPDRIKVAYSGIPRLSVEQEKRPNALRRRLQKNVRTIRKKTLDLVKEEHKKRKIDILLWFDADEVPTSHFPRILEEFFKKEDKKAIRSNYLQMFGDFHTFSNIGQTAHCRVFKYSPELETEPWNRYNYLYPLRKSDTYGGGYFFVHMADYSLDYIKERVHYDTRRKRRYVGRYIWRVRKDIRDLSTEEYFNIVRNEPPLMSINEYLLKNNINL